ncbi:MAG TPA: hypothetical protein VNN79_06190 [Actinomycetota bacterium]|nr:hypothetical protein [Actinomycetota bacterium]
MAYVRVTLSDGLVIEAGTAIDDGPHALAACATMVKDLWREAVGESTEGS